MGRYLDDYKPGDVDRFGHEEVTLAEVLAFAGRYDPQAFHLDEAAAAANPLFGRIAASGWHTAAMAMGMLVRQRQARGDDASILAGAGLDALRWHKPVYPGDILSVESEVLEVTPSKSRPDRGRMRSRTTVRNQAGEPVMRFEATEVMRRRGPSALSEAL